VARDRNVVHYASLKSMMFFVFEISFLINNKLAEVGSEKVNRTLQKYQIIMRFKFILTFQQFPKKSFCFDAK
jgi:hypothetical protein